MRQVRTTQASRQARRDPHFIGPPRPVGRAKSARGDFQKTCSECGASFTRLAGVSNADWAKRRYCSQPCAKRGRWKASLPNDEQYLAERSERIASGCLEWTGAVTGFGYGQATRFGKPFLAHRLAYQTHVGPMGDLAVCHKCDNPKCIEPTHLFLGTVADNNNDKIQKGRQAHGERSGGAKLTADQVRAIRQSDKTNAALGREYGVEPSNIGAIRNRKSWRHIA